MLNRNYYSLITIIMMCPADFVEVRMPLNHSSPLVALSTFYLPVQTAGRITKVSQFGFPTHTTALWPVEQSSILSPGLIVQWPNRICLHSLSSILLLFESNPPFCKLFTNEVTVTETLVGFIVVKIAHLGAFIFKYSV